MTARVAAGESQDGEPSALTAGHLLGGRVRYAQLRTGFRTGLEPVLLAAAVPARAGERVLEAGSGAGAGLLCLAARVPGVTGVGVERDAAQVAVAAANAAANGWNSLSFVAAEIERAEALGTFDHALSNPPYHAPEGTRSPQPEREAAKRRHESLLAEWAASLAARLHHGGTLTLILPAGVVPQALAALAAARCPARALLPLWPRTGQAAKLVLLQGVKDGRTPLRLLAGLVLHAEGGGFTAAAEAVLRDGTALSLGYGTGTGIV